MECSVFFCKRTKRSRVLLRSLQKNKTFSVFFYVLCKRMLRSLRSFTFLRKERIVLLGLISRQKLEKRMQKNVAFFKRTQKNDAFRREKNTVPNPAISKTLVSMVYFSDTPVLWCHAVIKDECKKRKQHENIVNRGLIMCTHGPGCGEGTGG